MSLDLADDKKKALERAVSLLEKAIAKANEMIATLTDDIAALTAGIVALDKSVAEATEDRKEENEEYKALMAADTAAMAQLANHDHSSVAPPPPPATWGAYSKKSEESGGVIGMIDLLIKDLDKEMTEAATTEKDSQADYEVMMRESAEKRVADSKSLADKQGTKADTEK